MINDHPAQPVAKKLEIASYETLLTGQSFVDTFVEFSALASLN
jgi:hypothetical protein